MSAQFGKFGRQRQGSWMNVSGKYVPLKKTTEAAPSTATFNSLSSSCPDCPDCLLGSFSNLRRQGSWMKVSRKSPLWLPARKGRLETETST